MVASSLEAVSVFSEVLYHSMLLYYFTDSSPSLTSKKRVPKELLLSTSLNNSLLLKIQVLGKDKPLRQRVTGASRAVLSHPVWTGLEKKSKEKREVAGLSADMYRKAAYEPWTKRHPGPPRLYPGFTLP